MASLIWDLDGTLIDSYDIIAKNIYLSYKGFVTLNQNVIRENVIKTSVTQHFIEVAKANNLPLHVLYDNYKRLTDLAQAGDYKLVKNVKDVLEELSAKGYKHYIYTHRDNSTNDILKANGIDHLFVEVVTIDNGFKRKPDSEALDYLINKYSMKKEETYYIGDRQLDVECGINAGIKTVYYNEAGKEHPQATVSINKYPQLISVLNIT